MKKDDLVVISMEDWPHDILFGVFRILCDEKEIKNRYYEFFCQQDSEDEHTDARWKWTDEMVKEGLLEKIPAADLSLGESWYPPKWEVLSEAEEG